MSTGRKSLKERLNEGFKARAGEKIPTSSLARLGRTAFNMVRGGRLVLGKKGRDGEEPEIDMDRVVKMINSVGKMKGVAMKMGQIMSYIDVAIPDELRDALSVLQTHSQAMPFEKVKAQIEDELGANASVLLANMDQVPISAASIGQVHKAILPDGTVAAVKIQYPEVAKAIESDFGPASVGTRLASLFYPNARIDDFVKEAKERFLEECDYLHEAYCQDRFQTLYRDHPILLVPKVFEEYCSRRVLTTEFIDAMSFDTYLETNPSQVDRDRLGEALFEFYMGSLFRNQLYNCDPHPGNYLFLANGRIAMLDHGCTRQFDARMVAKLANLTRAVHSDTHDAIHRALIGLKIVQPNKKYDFETIRGFLRGFYGPMLVDEVRGVDLSSAMDFREMQKKKMQLMKFSLPGEFLFLFRIRFGLMSVLSRLGAKANWYQLEKTYIEDFARKNSILSE